MGTIDERDVANLRAVADALPSKRFKTFFLFAKLTAFTREEIDAAKTLNDQWKRRAILLTGRELEPWHICQRTNVELNIDAHGGSAEQLANATAQIYFSPPPAPQANKPVQSAHDAPPKQSD